MSVTPRDVRIGAKRSSAGRSLLWWIALWAVAALLVGVLIALATHGTALTSVSDYSKASGTVTRIEPTNHESVSVRYSASGRQYEASSSFIGDPNPDFDHIRPGETVVVFYRRSDPSSVLLVDPATRIDNERASTAVASLAVATLLVAVNLSALLVMRRVRRG